MSSLLSGSSSARAWIHPSVLRFSEGQDMVPGIYLWSGVDAYRFTTEQLLELRGMIDVALLSEQARAAAAGTGS